MVTLNTNPTCHNCLKAIFLSNASPNKATIVIVLIKTSTHPLNVGIFKHLLKNKKYIKDMKKKYTFQNIILIPRFHEKLSSYTYQPNLLLNFKVLSVKTIIPNTSKAKIWGQRT